MAEDFPLFAFTLLLCTPSDLNGLCTEKHFDPSKVKKHLIDVLEFSATDADRLMTKLDKKQLFFHLPLLAAVAQTLQSVVPEYAGNGPHPPGTTAKEIIRRLTKC